MPALPGFNVLVQYPTELAIFAIPLKGRLASLLKERVPVLFLPEFFVIFR